ncbi:MAG: glutamine--fructose-6-phosphate transaminase (isomerizing) [Candidatus Woesearchaeota archaeon]
MCGIVGYHGRDNAFPALIDGLKKLEYRGYDSAGLALISDGNLKVVKCVGKVDELEQQVSSTVDISSSSRGIAHTRWATHGEPTEINAHPHTDGDERFAIVHNGIIENHSSLRRILEDEGYSFRSDTDSEVLVHLISKFYDGSLKEAVRSCLDVVDGAVGMLVISANDGMTVAARRGSPLMLGIGDDFRIIASDASAIIKHTKDVIYLEDDEIVSFTSDWHEVESLAGEGISKETETLKMSVEDVELSGYKHFMLKEIFEQPDSLRNVFRGRLSGDKVKLSIDIPERPQRIVVAACGTSWHSALIGKYLIEQLSDIPVEVDYASEFRYRDSLLSTSDLFIAISQSGETADTLAALREAKRKGARTLGIINVVGSTISREVDSGIYIHAGPEIGVASTKAFTSQVEALLLLAMALGDSFDKGIIQELRRLPGKIRQALDLSDRIREIAEAFTTSTNALYLGRGMNFPVALEGALKLKEISYIHAEGYPAAEMKHGPIALVDKDMPVIFIANRDKTFEKLMSNMQEINARSGRIITITDVHDSNIERLSEHVVKIPETNPFLSPILNTIPLQLLAYHVADLKGIDVDKPKNLAKSVTVE